MNPAAWFRGSADGQQGPGPVQGWEWLVLALAVVGGGVLRFWALGTFPPGLWYDEAINGLDALRILREPGWPVFFATYGHPREPMYMYLEVLGVLSGGATSVGIRGVSAVVGTLTIPAMWWFAREAKGPRVAAFAVLLFAGMRWHVFFSRLAFRTILAPLFGCLVAAFFIRTVRHRRWGDALACGALAGLSLYTYLSMRLFLVALALAGLVALWWGVDVAGRKILARRAAGAVLLSAVVFLPLGLNYWNNPGHFSGRESQISLLAQGRDGMARIAVQARDVALMPVLRGDHVGKHNIPGPPRFAQPVWWGSDGPADAAAWQDERRLRGDAARDPHGTGLAAFDVVTGLLLYVGLGLVAGGLFRRSWVDALVLLWLVLGSLASILSFGAPNMLRLLLLSPVAALAIALSLERVLSWLARSRWPRLAAAVLAVYGAWYFAGEGWRLLAVHPRHPSVYHEFNTNFAEAASWLAESTERPQWTVVPGFLATAPTFDFLADDARGAILPDSASPEDFGGERVWVMVPAAGFPPLDERWRLALSAHGQVRAFGMPTGTGQEFTWLQVFEATVTPR